MGQGTISGGRDKELDAGCKRKDKLRVTSQFWIEFLTELGKENRTDLVKLYLRCVMVNFICQFGKGIFR